MAADFTVVKKCKLRRSSSHSGATTANADSNSSAHIIETRNGTDAVVETEIDTTKRIKLGPLEEAGVRSDIDSSMTRDKDSDGKDAVNQRPKRHIMHKKLVSALLHAFCY